MRRSDTGRADSDLVRRRIVPAESAVDHRYTSNIGGFRLRFFTHDAAGLKQQWDTSPDIPSLPMCGYPFLLVVLSIAQFPPFRRDLL